MTARILVLAGALIALVPSVAALAQTPAITEFSSEQVDPKKLRGGAPRGPAQAPRINVAPRVNIAPRVNVAPRINVAPRNNFRVQGPGNNAIIRGPGLRGPANAFRGPVGVTTFRGVRANFVRGRHRFFRNGVYIPLVAIGALGAIAIGSRYYQPYAYVDGPGPDACMGPTDDGMCELRMTEVPLEDGTAAPQCVAYCPQQ
jgi:hypothetical protein